MEWLDDVWVGICGEFGVGKRVGVEWCVREVVFGGVGYLVGGYFELNVVERG